MNSSTIKKENTNYTVSLNDDGIITFLKVKKENNTSYETKLSYGNETIKYYEAFHDEKGSTDVLRQMNIIGSQYIRLGTKEKIISYGIGPIDKDFYDWNILFSLIEEFKKLESQDLNDLMKEYLNLEKKLEGIIR